MKRSEQWKTLSADTQYGTLPESLFKEDDLRKIVFDLAKEGKNPDLKIDGEYADVKRVLNESTTSRLESAVGKAAKQANIAIVYLNTQTDTKLMEVVAIKRFRNNRGLKRIEFRNPNGEYTIYTRQK